MYTHLHIYVCAVCLILCVKACFPSCTVSPAKKRRVEVEDEMASGDHVDGVDVQGSEPMEISKDLHIDADAPRRQG